MSDLISRNVEFFQNLATQNAKSNSALIENATQDNINALTELAINLLQGNLKISAETKQKLSKHKLFLRTLSGTKISISKKKSLLYKKRKVLILLVAPLLSVICTAAFTNLGVIG